MDFVLVTGAFGGMGKATVDQLVQAGYGVIALDRVVGEKTIKKSSASSRRKDGRLDQRTKEGKEAAARMAAARKAKGSLKNRLKRLFS